MSGPSAKSDADGGDDRCHPSGVPAAFDDYAAEELAQAPAFGPGKNGVLEATFSRADGGPTRLVRDRVEVPYHLTGTLETDPAPGLTTLVAQEPTGGVAQGDRHRLAVETRSDARAHVTTQSATKVHSMAANYAHLDVDLDARAGSYLEYLPGSTILNADARLLQTVTVDLEADAVVVVSDVLVPDGLSDHELFGFDHYHSRVEAEYEGRPVCIDAVDLRPADRDPRDPASVGDYGVVGSLYVFAPGREHATLIDRVHDRIEGGDCAETDGDPTSSDARDAVHAGVSSLPFEAGAVLRVLGHREADVAAAIRAAWDETRREFLGVGVPADRRY